MIIIETKILPSIEWDGKLGLYTDRDIAQNQAIWRPTKAECMEYLEYRSLIKYKKLGFYSTKIYKYVIPKDEFIFMLSAKSPSNVNICPDRKGILRASTYIERGDELLVDFFDYMGGEDIPKFMNLDPKKEDLLWLFKKS